MQDIKSDFKQWIGSQLGTDNFCIDPLKGDASFRSYYRVQRGSDSYIVMLAPPAKERTDIFVQIARTWKAKNLPVPEVLGWESSQGFVLLSDFGDTLLWQVLNEQTVDHYYQKATVLLQQIQMQDKAELPLFDAQFVLFELSIFQEWFLEKYLGLTLSDTFKTLLEKVNAQLVQHFISQPQVVTHRDYHSRNLMVLEKSDEFGLIDFQDAMVAPITYDLASLLKDCYIDWPKEKVDGWVNQYREKLIQTAMIAPVDETVFQKWFDWVGLQRHLKVLGVFSRLCFRDNKPQYLHYIPRIMNYVLNVTSLYPELAEFDDFLRQVVASRLTQQERVA